MSTFKRCTTKKSYGDVGGKYNEAALWPVLLGEMNSFDIEPSHKSWCMSISMLTSFHTWFSFSKPVFQYYCSLPRNHCKSLAGKNCTWHGSDMRTPKRGYFNCFTFLWCLLGFVEEKRATEHTFSAWVFKIGLVLSRRVNPLFWEICLPDQYLSFAYVDVKLEWLKCLALNYKNDQEWKKK